MHVNKAMQEVRCDGGRLWFMLNSQGLIEVKCRYCAAVLSKKEGFRLVVFHYWNAQTGDLVATRQFRDARDLVGG